MNERSTHTFYAATGTAAPERPALTRDVETDVCVIGGGFAGLWAAHSLLMRGREVVLLEAGEVAGAASGQNAGIVAAGFAERLEAIVDRVGLDDARALYQLSRDGVAMVRAMSGVDDSELAVKPGSLKVSRSGSEAAAAGYAEMLARDFNHALEPWSKARVRSTLVTERYHCGLFEVDGFHLHPLNLALRIAADIESRGGRIYQHSAAIDLDLDGIRKSVRTETGSVRAFHVVLAANTGLGEAFARLAATLLRVDTHIVVTEPLGEPVKQAIRFEGAIADTRRGGDYYHLLGDRLLWGGRIGMARKPPQKTAALMMDDMLRVYPQLKDVRIAHAWSGAMGYAVHRMPQIGMVRPGVWIASAFGGHGLNTAAMAGELVAAAIVEQDDRWRLFVPFGLVGTGGPAGRATMRAGYQAARLRERFAEARARQAERDEVAIAAGLAPGFTAHAGRRLKRRFNESLAGRITVRLFAGVKWLSCGVCRVLAPAGAAAYAALMAVGRFLAAVIWRIARVIGFAARIVGKAMDAVAALVRMAWRRLIAPALKRFLAYASLAGGRAKAGGIGFLQHARRAAGSRKGGDGATPLAQPAAADNNDAVAEARIAEQATAAAERPASGQGVTVKNGGKARKRKKKTKPRRDSVEA